MALVAGNGELLAGTAELTAEVTELMNGTAELAIDVAELNSEAPDPALSAEEGAVAVAGELVGCIVTVTVGVIVIVIVDDGSCTTAVLEPTERWVIASDPDGIVTVVIRVVTG